MTKQFPNVVISKADSYDEEILIPIIRRQMELAGAGIDFFKGKKIAVKPNLVSAKKPERAATTHPVLLSAVLKVILECSPSSIIIAESPGGPYNESALKIIYSACQISEAAEKADVPLNFDTSFVSVGYHEGEECRKFNFISPLANADVIINLPKLKSHSLTMLSAAVKNMYGAVPGVEKFEMHARYTDPIKFANMIVDLNLALMQSTEILTICDGILSMEGNGPTGGIPRKTGFLLTSLSPFCLDLAASKVIGFEGKVPMISHSIRRGLSPETADKLVYPDLLPDDVFVENFLPPESGSGKFLNNFSNILGGRLARFFQPHPEINTKKCIGCGKCRDSCPVGTIKIKESKKGKKAVIGHKKCIRCYCCQELCPINSVKTKKNLILKIVH